MNRKLLMTLLTLTLSLCSILGLTACGHEHSYITSVTAPTCTEQGYTTYSCSCGDSYVADYVNEKGHDWSVWISNDNGTHTRTCLRDSEHKENGNCLGSTATCIELAKCSLCNGEYGNYKNHQAKEEWSTTEKYHYHACKTNNCTEKLDHGKHTFDKNKQCTTCGYITITLLGTEISSDVYTIDGTNLYVKVPNKQISFAFAETINVAEGATYKVYTDIQCKEESNIPSYMVNDLVVGDNTYYFLVNNEGSFPKIYTVTVRRRPMYDVTFSVNGGTAVDKQVVEEDDFATEPTTTKTGYTFDGWDYDFNNPITKNTTITASWVESSNTAYKVEYYLENLENDNYSILSIATENLTGTTNSTVYAEIKTFEHFTAEQSQVSGVINANGTTVIKV